MAKNKKIKVGWHGRSRLVPAEQLSFRISAYAIIIERGRVLLQRSRYDTYYLPGGAIEKGEEIVAAVIRELQEETGHTVKVGRLIDAATTFFEPELGRPYHALSLFYHCKRRPGKTCQTKMCELEQAYIVGFEWVPLLKLSKIKFDDKGVKAAIQSATKV